MAKKIKTKQILWIAIIAVAAIDAFSSVIGTIPILGDIVAMGGNLLWEIVELALVFGLMKSK